MITLETIPTPGATPIANNAASAKAFANDYYRIAVPSLSTRGRKTLIVLAMIHSLASAGANYKANHAGLMQDATVYTGGISQFDVWAAFAATLISAVNASDATLSMDVPTLMAEGRDIENKSEDELDRMIGFLAAQLGI